MGRLSRKTCTAGASCPFALQYCSRWRNPCRRSSHCTPNLGLESTGELPWTTLGWAWSYCYHNRETSCRLLVRACFFRCRIDSVTNSLQQGKVVVRIIVIFCFFDE